MRFLTLKQNAYFLKKYASNFYDYLCLSKLLQSAKVYPYDEIHPSKLFVHFLVAFFENIMSHANCLTHCFCAEFLHGSCLILFL